MKVGDTVTFKNMAIYRSRWWRFWEPKVRYEDRDYVVTHETSSTWEPHAIAPDTI